MVGWVEVDGGRWVVDGWWMEIDRVSGWIEVDSWVDGCEWVGGGKWMVGGGGWRWMGGWVDGWGVDEWMQACKKTLMNEWIRAQSSPVLDHLRRARVRGPASQGSQWDLTWCPAWTGHPDSMGGHTAACRPRPQAPKHPLQPRFPLC